MRVASRVSAAAVSINGSQNFDVLQLAHQVSNSHFAFSTYSHSASAVNFHRLSSQMVLVRLLCFTLALSNGQLVHHNQDGWDHFIAGGFSDEGNYYLPDAELERILKVRVTAAYSYHHCTHALTHNHTAGSRICCLPRGRFAIRRSLYSTRCTV